jgi:IclR family acetate operon transcriptional repressor
MRPVQIALQIVTILSRIQPAGVSEIAREIDLPKSTVQRALKTLAEAEWIEPAARDRAIWSLSVKAGLAVGGAHFATRKLRMTAFPVMEELRQRTRESVYLAIRDGHEIGLIERLDSLAPVLHAWPLWRGGPMHSTSLGRAILAGLPSDELEDYLVQPLRVVGSQKAVTVADLRAEVEETRRRGFATSLGDNLPDENAVGACIRDSHGRPFASISISGPASRMSRTECLSVGELVADAARRIGQGLARGGDDRM